MLRVYPLLSSTRVDAFKKDAKMTTEELINVGITIIEGALTTEQYICITPNNETIKQLEEILLKLRQIK